MSDHAAHPKRLPPRRGKRGFTLVELLVVIGIIAVLMGLLLAGLAKARAAANRTVCLSNIRQLGIGILMYCDDNNGWFPTCAYAESNSFIPYPDDWLHWQNNRNLLDSAIARYVSGNAEALKKLLWCPADSLDGRQPLPSIMPGQGPYLYTYSLNSRLGQNVRSGQLRTKITWWRSPARKIMMTEGWERFPTAGWSYSVPLTRRHGAGRFHGNVPGNPEFAFGAKRGARVSAVFIDGHAEGIDQNFAFNEIHDRPKAK